MDEMFSVFVRRMRLCRAKNDLYRPASGRACGLNAFRSWKISEARFSYSRKPPRKTDRQSVRIQQRAHGDHLPRIDAVFRPARRCTFPGECRNFRLRNTLTFQSSHLEFSMTRFQNAMSSCLSTHFRTQITDPTAAPVRARSRSAHERH